MSDALLNALVKTRESLADAIRTIDATFAAMPKADPVERVLAMMRAMPDKRDLYETQSGYYRVTYSGDELPYRSLQKEQVQLLEHSGVIEAIWPGCYKLAGTKRYDRKGNEITPEAVAKVAKAK